MFFNRLFGWLKGQSQTPKQEDARKISPAMPMAAAGAMLDAERPGSETEDSLRRAVGEIPQQGE